eukprot:TRINITY_DN48472_c0_g1_i1.p1 TRINITY_DN48472_c0_g1~~TRINITY_DN48472_c0_g1_i1.p1  ORF type:complete len:1179 (+),score=186.43 TRINITY_DN48472_c0_g1_i1:63-3599(+)
MLSLGNVGHVGCLNGGDVAGAVVGEILPEAMLFPCWHMCQPTDGLAKMVSVAVASKVACTGKMDSPETTAAAVGYTTTVSGHGVADSTRGGGAPIGRCSRAARKSGKRPAARDSRLCAIFRKEVAVLRSVRGNNGADNATISAAVARLRAALQMNASVSVGGDCSAMATQPPSAVNAGVSVNGCHGTGFGGGTVTTFEMLDGSLLGLAAAQCARLARHDLLPLLCEHAYTGLPRLGGRAVAELAAASAKLSHFDSRFFQAVANFCAAPPRGAFSTSLRDISLMATSVFQSWRSSTHGVDHAAALRGLARVALPHLQTQVGAASARDAAELAHALAHTLQARPLRGGPPLHRDNVVAKALCQSLERVTSSCSSSSNGVPATARDLAVAAGAAAAAWDLLDTTSCAALSTSSVSTATSLAAEPAEAGGIALACSFSDTLRDCLQTVASQVSQRRKDFNVQDLAVIAHAVARLEDAGEDDGLVAALNERFAGMATGWLTPRELGLALWAAARGPLIWRWAAFAESAVVEVERRKLTVLSAQDICTFAQSLSRLSGVGGFRVLQKLANEAFQRQLWGFSPRDKASMLWTLAKAKASFSHDALVRLLVVQLGAGHTEMLSREAVCMTLVAMAELWEVCCADVKDDSPHRLLRTLHAARPWVGATAFELGDIAMALGKLEEAPSADAWVSLFAELTTSTLTAFSVRDLCRILGGLAGCPAACGVRCRWTISRLVAELTRRASLNELPTKDDLSIMLDAFAQVHRPLPSKLHEFVVLVRATEDKVTTPIEEANIIELAIETDGGKEIVGECEGENCVTCCNSVPTWSATAHTSCARDASTSSFPDSAPEVARPHCDHRKDNFVERTLNQRRRHQASPCREPTLAAKQRALSAEQRVTPAELSTTSADVCVAAVAFNHPQKQSRKETSQQRECPLISPKPPPGLLSTLVSVQSQPITTGHRGRSTERRVIRRIKKFRPAAQGPKNCCGDGANLSCGHFHDCGHAACDCGEAHPHQQEEGQGHGHGHGHSHGHCHGHEQDRSHEEGKANSSGSCSSRNSSADSAASVVNETACDVVTADAAKCAIAALTGSHKSESCHYQIETSADTAAASSHGTCVDNSCCPAVACLGKSGDDLRLNRHCTFRGHCVQMKNTFIHIPCDFSDSDSDTDCIVCRIRGSQSCEPASSA